MSGKPWTYLACCLLVVAVVMFGSAIWAATSMSLGSKLASMGGLLTVAAVVAAIRAGAKGE